MVTLSIRVGHEQGAAVCIEGRAAALISWRLDVLDRETGLEPVTPRVDGVERSGGAYAACANRYQAVTEVFASWCGLLGSFRVSLSCIPFSCSALN
jgi:hypothetical protein